MPRRDADEPDILQRLSVTEKDVVSAVNLDVVREFRKDLFGRLPYSPPLDLAGDDAPNDHEYD
jgi:hypothetical protein